ncbi:MAG: cupin domain-containing protein, partial [Actinomycetota bacterium]
STAGSLAVYRSVIDGPGPPPHVHSHEDETIFVLAGMIEADCGDETFRATEGDLIFLPRGFMHTFRSLDGPAEILFLVTPGRLDEFFAERDRLLAEGADRSDIAKLASSYF